MDKVSTENVLMAAAGIVDKLKEYCDGDPAIAQAVLQTVGILLQVEAYRTQREEVEATRHLRSPLGRGV